MEKTYPHSTIGGHTVTFKLTFKKDETVGAALEKIRKREGFWPQTEAIFVVDTENKLLGKIDFKVLLYAKPNQILEKIMEKDFFVATAHSHQKTIAKAAVREGLENIPVVDAEGHFLGIVDSTQILKILHEENVEELMKFSGILTNEDEILAPQKGVWELVAARGPWLILGLAGGIIATVIVGKFELVLEREIALSFFIPVIVYMNAAVGTQTQTIYIRRSAVDKIKLAKYLFQEFKIAVIIGGMVSFLIIIFESLWFRETGIGFIVGLSMFIGVMSSIFVGVMIPWFLDKAGRDPAIGSGPFATIIQDILSIVIYFSIASALL